MTGRDKEMLTMYLRGFSMSDVGEEYGISRQRVHQIIGPLLDERHHGKLRREKYAGKILAAYQRILSGESTLQDEADAMGIKTHSLRVAFRHKKLKLPRKEAPLHGTRYRYAQGCKCDECRGAVAAYQRTFRGREPNVHGTLSSYTNYACRCDPCKEAGSKRNREYKERRKALVAR